MELVVSIAFTLALAKSDTVLQLTHLCSKPVRLMGTLDQYNKCRHTCCLSSASEHTCTGYFLSYAKCNMPRFNGKDCRLVLL